MQHHTPRGGLLVPASSSSNCGTHHQPHHQQDQQDQRDQQQHQRHSQREAPSFSQSSSQFLQLPAKARPPTPPLCEPSSHPSAAGSTASSSTMGRRWSSSSSSTTTATGLRRQTPQQPPPQRPRAVHTTDQGTKPTLHSEMAPRRRSRRSRRSCRALTMDTLHRVKACMTLASQVTSTAHLPVPTHEPPLQRDQTRWVIDQRGPTTTNHHQEGVRTRPSRPQTQSRSAISPAVRHRLAGPQSTRQATQPTAAMTPSSSPPQSPSQSKSPSQSQPQSPVASQRPVTAAVTTNATGADTSPSSSRSLSAFDDSGIARDAHGDPPGVAHAHTASAPLMDKPAPRQRTTRKVDEFVAMMGEFPTDVDVQEFGCLALAEVMSLGGKCTQPCVAVLVRAVGLRNAPPDLVAAALSALTAAAETTTPGHQLVHSELVLQVVLSAMRNNRPFDHVQAPACEYLQRVTQAASLSTTTVPAATAPARTRTRHKQPPALVSGAGDGENDSSHNNSADRNENACADTRDAITSARRQRTVWFAPVIATTATNRAMARQTSSNNNKCHSSRNMNNSNKSSSSSNDNSGDESADYVEHPFVANAYLVKCPFPPSALTRAALSVLAPSFATSTASTSPAAAVEALAHGIASTMLMVLDAHPDRTSLLHLAVDVLVNLTRHSSAAAVCEQLACGSGVRSVVQIMAKHGSHAGLQRVGCTLLAQLVSSSSSSNGRAACVRGMVASRAIATAVLPAMRTHARDRALQLAALGVLEAVVATAAIRAIALDTSGSGGHGSGGGAVPGVLTRAQLEAMAAGVTASMAVHPDVASVQMTGLRVLEQLVRVAVHGRDGASDSSICRCVCRDCRCCQHGRASVDSGLHVTYPDEVPRAVSVDCPPSSEQPQPRRQCCQGGGAACETCSFRVVGSSYSSSAGEMRAEVVRVAATTLQRFSANSLVLDAATRALRACTAIRTH
ncbi:hypothetical protein PTSG_05137 [Salpingoeca rosetta]|uniref:Uncharacterized protein n=1 Tax=Salpingoeca rosetta (strain ATCC 50818 / BSB-021) TaxID=946362 RepID=F2UAL8_SALR5|nr:uncharacterized protein PTSG_05137 [Salpingoeca rosetta]EGD73434.1 hypothetical protein PTSG_05137 [Salpingoeca rosetta]|eukprot:XP_004993716.1 hypothetical protein PTSG_05137 [Salpingoeca rosetta]